MTSETNCIDRRCYNEKSIKKALKKARKEAKRARRQAEAAVSQPEVQDTSDTDVIVAFAEVRELGLAWVQAGLGSLEQFKNALAADYDRMRELFGSYPVR